MLIVFSGVDGAGKSTQIELLSSVLERGGSEVVRLWGRGGYTPGFERVKHGIRKLMGKKLPKSGASSARRDTLNKPWVAQLWLWAAILDLIWYWGGHARVLQWMGQVVICDRYLDDTRLDFRRNFPHTSFEDSILWRILIKLVPRPDVAFLLWVPVDESLRRSLAKNEPFPDDAETLRWRLSAYLDEQNFPTDLYMKLECTIPPDELASSIMQVVSRYPSFQGGAGAA